MAEDLGPTLISLTDEDGNEITLEFIDALEYNGSLYYVFLPTESDDEDAKTDDEAGLIILKVIEENGEELLSTPDTDEEEEAVYNLYMEQLFEEDDA